MTGAHLIGIAGPSGAGKTRVACALAERLSPDVPVLPLDAYYRDHPPDPRPHTNVGDFNFDHPDALDLELLVDHLGQLAAGHAVDQPLYDFRTHRRQSETRRLVPHAFVLVEGLLTLYWPEVRALLETRIFISADTETCLSRRLTRDTRDRGRTQASVRHQWSSTVYPMAQRYVEPTRVFADAVVDGTQSVDRVVETIIHRLDW